MSLLPNVCLYRCFCKLATFSASWQLWQHSKRCWGSLVTCGPAGSRRCGFWPRVWEHSARSSASKELRRSKYRLLRAPTSAGVSSTGTVCHVGPGGRGRDEAVTRRDQPRVCHHATTAMRSARQVGINAPSTLSSRATRNLVARIASLDLRATGECAAVRRAVGQHNACAELSN